MKQFYVILWLNLLIMKYLLVPIFQQLMPLTFAASRNETSISGRAAHHASVIEPASMGMLC